MFSRFLAAALVVLPFVTSATAATCSRTYQVVAGDYCDAISAAHNVSTYQLATLNFPTVNAECSNLQIGQTICLGTQGEDCSATYVVQPDDTCERVMDVFGVNATILSLNNPQINSDCTNIYVGEVLCVNPAVAVPPAAAGVAVPSTPVITQSTATAVATPEPVLPTTPAPVPVPTSVASPAPVSSAAPSSSSSDDGNDDDLPFCDELDDEDQW